jgi:Flp pilus assembly protein TadD
VASTPPSAAPAPSAAPSAASAPPPRPATIPLGEGELAAGDAAFEQNDFASAKQHYLAAPKGVASQVGLARVRIAQLGLPLDYAAGQGNAEVVLGEKELSAAAATKPPFGPAFVELGRARLLLGEAEGAVTALREGTRLLPNEPEAHSQLGIALLATGHAADSVLELTRACELDPGSAARHGNLGTALMMAGRTKEAAFQYEARVRLDDGDARAHSDLGTALLGLESLDRALAELQRAVALDPNHASYHSNLGFALQRAGRIDRATAEYKQAIALDPTLASAWINLATVLARDPKTFPEARSALLRAATLSPDDPRVKANLDELDALQKASRGASQPPSP